MQIAIPPPVLQIVVQRLVILVHMIVINLILNAISGDVLMVMLALAI